jgi:hypothetical protein
MHFSYICKTPRDGRFSFEKACPKSFSVTCRRNFSFYVKCDIRYSIIGEYIIGSRTKKKMLAVLNMGNTVFAHDKEEAKCTFGIEPGFSLFMTWQRMLPLLKQALKSSSEGSSGRFNVTDMLLSQAATSDLRVARSRKYDNRLLAQL